MHRRLSISLLLLSALACGRDQRVGSNTVADAARAEAARGPDPILLRLPRKGGTVRAYLYPRLDSVVWSGHATSVDRALGFDPEGGTLDIVDAKGLPVRVDLRLGESAIATRTQMSSIVAPAGADIFGVDPKGNAVRVARSSTWTFQPPVPARAVFPQSNGDLVIAGQRGSDAVLWLMRPPDTRVRDTVVLPIAMRGIHAQVGDRVYFATDSGLVGVRGRDLTELPTIHVPGRVVALAPTPSGDRIYVAMANDTSLAVIDRYTDKVASTIALPGRVAELRMDALGRYVLARPVRGDSAWVIAVATNHVVGSVLTRWTADLPATAPDGAIALNSGRDVIFVDGETLQAVRTIAGGASDFWYFTFWNGFRARAAGVDQPVSFPADTAPPPDSAAASDSATMTIIDSVTRPVRPAPSLPAPGAPPGPRPQVQPAAPRQQAPPTATSVPTPAMKPAPTASAAAPFTVSFAALLNEAKAHALADSITVAGVRARVVPSQRAGTTIYRVVLGPYPNRAAAEQIGRDSKRSYWVFPGQP